MGRPKKRKEVRVELSDIADDMYGNIDDVIKALSKMKEKFEDKGFRDLVIDRDSYGYDGPDEFTIVGVRTETDAEYNRRIKKEAKQRERAIKKKKEKKDKDIAEMQRLAQLYPHKLMEVVENEKKRNKDYYDGRE